MLTNPPASDPTRSKERLRVHAVFWNALGPGSVAYTVTELLENLPQGRVDRTLWCLRSDPRSPREHHRAALPGLIYRALCKVRVPASLQGKVAGRTVLRSLEPGDILYIWPPYDLGLIKAASDRGAIVVAERINCMAGMCRDVLSRAFARRGLPLPEGWFTPRMIDREREQMLACDFVTAPNPLVTQSLLEAGIPSDRILETSYGFSPERLAAAIDIQRPLRPPTFAFVGAGIVRKGLDVLLEAWEKADIDGKLVIAGQVGDDILRDYGRVLDRPDVEQLGFVEDIASVYAAAEIFVFPTHEEGGPQVTYEAAACGLASIVSPMGAGRVVRDQQECLLVDPLDVDDVAAAITRLAQDGPLRRTLGQNASQRAREFSWSKVGARLYDQLSAASAGS